MQELGEEGTQKLGQSAQEQAEVVAAAARRALTRNAFVESFNGRLRAELLNETLFTSLAHARAALPAWQADYNTVRPPGAIGNLPPAIYATLSAPDMQRDGTPRAIGGSAPRPVAPPSPTGSNDEQTLLIAG